jgi:hypothetical protein
MPGQMCWLNKFGSEHKILHLRLQPHQPWKPYNLMSGLSVPDYNIPNGSKGMATFHALKKAGWQTISTQDAYKIIADFPQQEAA